MRFASLYHSFGRGCPGTGTGRRTKAATFSEPPNTPLSATSDQTCSPPSLVVWIIEWLKKKAKKQSRCSIIGCIIRCVIGCIVRYLERLCKMSTIVVGVTGQSFVASGRTVNRLFTKSFGSMALAGGVWWIPPMIVRSFCLMGGFAWGMGAALFLFGDPLPLIGVAVAVYAWVVLNSLTGILLAMVDTIFMCFLIDMDRGVITKPNIHAILGDVIRSKTKTPLVLAPVNGGGGAAIVQQQPQPTRAAAPVYDD